MKNRFFIYFSYNGASYCGWQFQPNGISVQEVMTKAISTILREKIEVVAAGRTDAGVHAKKMVAHIDFKKSFLPDKSFVNKLNSFLPNDISIQQFKPVKRDAHARFDAIFRKYNYLVTTEKDVFLHDYAMRLHHPLDFNLMNQAAKILFDYEDFTSFSKVHTDVKTNNCTIQKAEWKRKDSYWVFTIEANRFLRNMVRAIVGTLLEVGKGKIDLMQFKSIIEAKNRSAAGTSVPAKALYLVDVIYPKEVFIRPDSE